MCFISSYRAVSEQATLVVERERKEIFTRLAENNGLAILSRIKERTRKTRIFPGLPSM